MCCNKRRNPRKASRDSLYLLWTRQNVERVQRRATPHRPRQAIWAVATTFTSSGPPPKVASKKEKERRERQKMSPRSDCPGTVSRVACRPEVVTTVSAAEHSKAQAHKHTRTQGCVWVARLAGWERNVNGGRWACRLVLVPGVKRPGWERGGGGWIEGTHGSCLSRSSNGSATLCGALSPRSSSCAVVCQKLGRDQLMKNWRAKARIVSSLP